MSTDAPKTFAELFDFYKNEVKPLYAAVQVDYGKMPVEILNEINAAFDHISRLWIYAGKETEESAVSKAYGHLKRSCLDIFKLGALKAFDRIKDLRRITTLHLIDNGEFVSQLNLLEYEIEKGSIDARRFEGEPERGFGEWKSVYEKCISLRELYCSKNIPWAKSEAAKISRNEKWKTFILGVVSGLVSGLAVWYIVKLLS